MGPFHFAALLQPFVLFLLPNLVFVGAILFTIGALARQTIPVYLGAIGIVISYLVAVNNLSGPETPMRLALGDPLGISVLRMIRYWTPAESNTRLVGFPAMLMLNRAIWLAVAAAVLGVLHRRFRFGHDDGGGRRKSRQTVVAPAGTTERIAPVAIPRVSGTFGPRMRVRQTLAIARHSLEEIALSRAGLATLIIAIALQGYYRFEVGLHLKILFGLSLFQWALIAALPMVVHVIVNQKYLGHAVVIFAFVFTMSTSLVGIFHNLLIYGKDPGWIYSDMNCLLGSRSPFLTDSRSELSGEGVDQVEAHAFSSRTPRPRPKLHDIEPHRIVSACHAEIQPVPTAKPLIVGCEGARI